MSYPALMSEDTALEKADSAPDELEYLDQDDNPVLIQKGRKLRPHVIAEVMKRYKRYRREGKRIMEACELVAEKMGLQTETVYAVQNRMQPTTGLATDMLKAGAAKLMGRVLRKANVDQAIDLLSRANIGVLAPEKGGGGDTGSQFVIGVAVDSLGAVKVGVQIGSQPQPRAEVAPPSVNVYTEGEDEGESPTEIEVLAPKVVKELPPKTSIMASSMATREAQARAEERAEKAARLKEKRQVRKAAQAIKADLLKGGGE